MSTEGNTGAAVPKDYAPDKRGLAARWADEVAAAEKALKRSWENGEKALKAFLDEREVDQENQTRWNLWHANVQQLMAMLYGNIPRADVSRRFADSADDVARVAGEIGQRILHADIEKRSDTAREAFGDALQDWRIPGGAMVRVRYSFVPGSKPGKPAVMRGGKEAAAAVPPVEVRKSETAHVDYVHWKDVLWSPAHTWSQVYWVGFAADMPHDDFVARFGGAKKGEALWERVPKQSVRAKDEEKAKDPWARVRVWELWHKPEGKVYWYVKGFDEVLDVQDDPLRLDGFWPCPKPLLCNTTTSSLVFKSDYCMATDLYAEINSVSTRIDTLQRAIKAAGTYDKDSPELRSILDEGVQNQMLPSENWAAFLQKGGLQGSMQFLPLDVFVVALSALRDYRRELVDALYQVTGQADIMRGQATQSGATAHEQSIKAKFGSVRVQRMQDEFARFVSEAQALKLEVICKHFLPETILQQSNAEYAFREDEKAQPGLLRAAVELLKSEYSCYRVEVKPESVSLTDFASLKQDRTELIASVSSFIQAAMPAAQAMPGSMPFLLELLQALVAGLRGSSTMEGILDRAIEQAKRAQEAAASNPQQQRDPKLQAEQMKAQTTAMKGQADMEKERFKLQGKLMELQAETQAKAQQERIQADENVREAALKQQVAAAGRALEPAPPPGVKPRGAQ